MGDTYFQTYLDAIRSLPDKQVLGEEWVIDPPNPDFGYDSTPKNALTFADMGVDGVHYAILTIGGLVRDDSPVISIYPIEGECSVLSDSFLGYLSDCCGVPVAEMEQLFAEERAGRPTLASFLKANFDQSRLFGEEHWHRFDHCLQLIERKK